MRAILATMRGAIEEARANRAALGLQVTIMVVNDVAWVIFWVIFFHRVGTVRGWDTSRVLLLLAVLTTAGGIVLGFLSNARRIGRLAADGEFDAALALPVSPLSYILVRRIETTNLGDVLFGITLFAVAGAPTIERTAIFAIGVIAAAALLTGFLVAAGSTAFFTGKGEAGDFGFNAMLLLASYPAEIFTGATKALLYTVVPAAFVASVPAGLIDSFDVGTALLLLGAAFGFVVLGWVMFTIGMRRYTSGAVWTRA